MAIRTLIGSLPRAPHLAGWMCVVLIGSDGARAPAPTSSWQRMRYPSVTVPGAAVKAATAPLEVLPLLEFDKTRFALGEAVFFWVGVTTTDGSVITAGVRGTCCELTIVRPDGTQRVERIPWPVGDGSNKGGWRGGMGLGEPPQLGRYTAVLDVDGHRTPERAFTVEDVPLLKQITARFDFPSPLVLGTHPGIATLVIKNHSAETLQFAKRAGGLTPVSVSVRQPGVWGSDGFFPDSVLVQASGLSAAPTMWPSSDRFDWDAAKWYPSVTLAPGQTYRLDLPLSAALDQVNHGASPMPPGQYEIQLWTNLDLLIGAPGGPFADLCPVRLAVTSTAVGVR